ncbi:MAG: TIGR00296 family protein [Methanomassiliicoccales archaeon]|nr:MAG: TIGR00296 family protein [Methanomassiliicoccales archaeon]
MEHGRFAVRVARGFVEAAVSGEEFNTPEVPDIFLKKSGVFVTINTYPKHNLRGCIGYPEPLFPLIEALERASKSAALEDPRFPSVREEELDLVVVETSLLTPPELIEVKKPKHYVKEVEIGRDGLIVEKGFRKGLLLPQVPVEWKWKVDEFLSHTCMKAGLLPDSWLDEDIKIYRFTAKVFSELEPRGEIVEKLLKE